MPRTQYLYIYIWPPQKERPWVTPANRGPIWWGYSKLHKSHRAAWYRGVLFCSRCGHFSKRAIAQGLGKKCQVNPGGRCCQMTMNIIRHGTKRAGFQDWPMYDNKPGKEEPEIARCAIPDPTWVEEPPPRTYNTGKTVTGAKIAEKIRDLRFRRNITGSTAMPRPRHKTHPMQIGAAQEVAFEEEVAKYKQESKSMFRRNGPKNKLEPHRPMQTKAPHQRARAGKGRSQTPKQ